MDLAGREGQRPREQQVAGATRFVPGDQLGVGAMGTVVRAFDRGRRQDVALKYLRNVNPDGLYRFKQEFRLLAEVVHPHVVTLYELIADDGRWAVAMELVEGARSLLDYVRPFEHLRRRGAAVAADGTPDSTSSPPSSRSGGDPEPTRSIASATSDTSVPSRSEAVPATVAVEPGETLGTGIMAARAPADPRRQAIAMAELQPERLQAALRQLVGGLAHVHRRELLHRDIKPSNVLVDVSGRVVICDFGLVVASGASEGGIFGTPTYMSPEQARGEPLSPASDLYSVGVMLYEALTGQVPVNATQFGELVAAKQDRRFPDVRDRAPEADPRLAELCMALLSPDPERRPDAGAILAQLRDDQPGTTSRLAIVSTVDRSQLVGRETERTRLREALRDTRSGGTVAVVLAGPSGAGKSALMATACEEMRVSDGAVILAGRCYQTESVPFKALDAVIDELATHLRAMELDTARGCIPPDLGALVQLFPVLRMAPAVTEALARAADASPDHLLRPRAQQALRALLTALARLRPLVIVIDDVQWSDPDSEPFLRTLVEATESPGLLLIASYRTDGELPSPLRSEDTQRARDLRQISLQPLDDASAAALVKSIAGDDVTTDAVRRIVADAGGNALFVTELAHAMRLGRATSASAGLDALLTARIDALPRSCQQLLEATALTAWPQPLPLLSRALGLDSEAAALAHLRAARLIRIIASRDGERITTYHDRVRECAAERLSPRQRRRLHRKLARAFESAPELDVEALAAHWRGAEDDQRATHYALRAAERALEARAYRRAADHYQRVLGSDVPLPEAQRSAAATARADALFFAGSVREAADAYLSEAERSDPETAAVLRSQALICLLRAYDLVAAENLARDVGRASGLTIPTRRGAVASILWGRLRLRRSARLRAPEEVTASTRVQLDVARDVSGALGLTSPLQGFAVHTRYLHSARTAGDPWHVCYALCQEAAFLAAARGARADHAIARALGEASRAAEASGQDSVAAIVDGYGGFAAYLQLHRLSDAARGMLGSVTRLEAAPELTWLADVLRQYGMQAMALGGHFRELEGALGPTLTRARATGNDYLRDNVSRLAAVFAHLAADRPDAAVAQSAAPAAGGDELTLDVWYHQCYLAEAEAYAGDIAAAGSRLESLWREMRRAPASMVPSGRCWTAFARARVHARGLLEMPAAREQHLALLRASCASLTRERRSLPVASRACAALARAMLADARGDEDALARELREAITWSERMQSNLIAMPARHALGALIGGDEGAALRAEAERWLDEESVAAPARLLRWLLPIEPA